MNTPINDPKLGLLTPQGVDARGFEIYKSPNGSLITKQGSQLVLSHAGASSQQVGAQTATPQQTGSSPAFDEHPINAAMQGETVPIRRFAIAMQEMLKQYQGIRGDQLAQGQGALTAAQNKASDAILAKTPDENLNLSPGSQAAIRGSQVAGANQLTNDLSSALQKEDARSQAFLETVDKFRQIGMDMYGDQMKMPSPEVLSSYKNLVESGKMQLSDIPADQLKFVVGTLDASKVPTSPDILLKQAQIEQTLKQTGMLDQLKPSDLVDIIDKFGSQDAPFVVSAVNNKLGQKANLPLVESESGLGYQFGDKTFYGSAHEGIDMMAPAGSKVAASVPLVVTNVFVGKDGGLQIWAKDSFGGTQRFMHLGDAFVKPGDKIEAGDTIATVGSPKEYSATELSTGSHLHFDVQNAQGQFVDPTKYMGLFNTGSADANNPLSSTNIPGKNNTDKLLSPTEAQALGVPYGTTQSGAYGKTPTKEPSQEQYKSAGFASRIANVNQVMAELTKNMGKLGTLGLGFQGMLPNFLKSSNYQSLQQAENDFLTAKLRQESGAAIAQSEIDGAKIQYFPQPGDSKSTLEQKKKNRELILQGLIQQAGSAYMSPEDLLSGSSTKTGANGVDPALNALRQKYNY